MSWLWFFIGLVVGNVCGWLARVQVEDFQRSITAMHKIFCSHCFDEHFLGYRFMLAPRSCCCKCGKLCLGYIPTTLDETEQETSDGGDVQCR